MARILCTLPNASTLINGHQFTQMNRGMVSAEMTDEEAEAFAAIPGFALSDNRGKTDADNRAEADAKAAALEAKKVKSTPAAEPPVEADKVADAANATKTAGA
jgi:hypothetical protein